MARKHAFRAGDLREWNQLEPRLALSQGGLAHAAAAAVHTVAVHHAAPHHAVRVHGKAAHHESGSSRSRGPGPTAQSNITAPIVVLPVSTPLASAPPVSSPASSTPADPGSPAPTPTPPATIGIPSVSSVMTDQEQEIVDLVNQTRTAAGLAPLQVSPLLVEEAHIQSTDMAELGVMSHVLPGAALPTLESRAQYVGYNYLYLGENIAYGYPDDNSVMTAWMNSPEHEANIMDPNYTQIGVGIAYDGQGNPYYTQEFGQPA